MVLEELHHAVNKVVFKEKGLSTLKPRKIWFDDTVQRLNVDDRGDLLGEFKPDDDFTGIYLAGGGSMLRGLDKRISKKTDLPVFIAEDPLRAVVRGTGITLKNIERYKNVLVK